MKVIVRRTENKKIILFNGTSWGPTFWQSHLKYPVIKVWLTWKTIDSVRSPQSSKQLSVKMVIPSYMWHRATVWQLKRNALVYSMTIYGEREAYINHFNWRYSLKYGGNDLSESNIMQSQKKWLQRWHWASLYFHLSQYSLRTIIFGIDHFIHGGEPV